MLSASAKNVIRQAVGKQPHEPASAARATSHIDPFVPKSVGVGSGTTQVKGGALAALVFTALAGATDMPNGTNGTFGNGTIGTSRNETNGTFGNGTVANWTSPTETPADKETTDADPNTALLLTGTVLVMCCTVGGAVACVKTGCGGCCEPKKSGGYASPNTQMSSPSARDNV
jgi:hypothetical protein